jgi:hypothetical protein
MKSGLEAWGPEALSLIPKPPSPQAPKPSADG